MSRKSRKGFQKLENHELAEFTTLQGEESGSDSEMVELSREDNSGKGSACCWCVALYLVLLTCFLVLMTMVAIYFGYNVMRISSDYSHRLDSLEDRISKLDSRMDSTQHECSDKMEQLQKLVVQVNTSLFDMKGSTDQQQHSVQGRLGAVEGRVKTLQDQISDFESHPPTIGEDEVQEMRSNMAEFKSHLESYDSQLSDVMRNVGDARHELSQTDERVELLKRNVTSLKGSLSGLQLQDRDTINSLELLSAQFSALQIVVRDINETVNQEVALTSEELNETRSGLENVQQQLLATRTELLGLISDIGELNDTLNRLAGEVVVMTEPADSATQSTDASSEPSTEPTSPTTEPTKPATEPTKPATEPTSPTTEPTKPATEPTSPTTEPTKPATEPTSPTTEPTKPATEPTSPSTEPTSPTTEPTKPATEPTSPTTEPTKPATEPTSPSTEPTSPSTEPTNPATEPVPVSTLQPNNSNSTDAVDEPSSDTTPQSTEGTPQPSAEVNSSSGNSMSGNETTKEVSEPANEKEQPVATPPSGQPMTMGTHTVDSTGATEDIPASAGDLNTTAQNITGNKTDMQPPTSPSILPAEPTRNETDTPSPNPTVDTETPPATSDPIKVLQALLEKFDDLDVNGDAHLDIYEFSNYFWQSSASQSVFERLDANGDTFITKEEIIVAIRLLEGEAAEETTDSLGSNVEGNAAETQSSNAPVSPGVGPGTESSPPSDNPTATELLGDILLNFPLLDTNKDDGLSQNEFSVYFGGLADYTYVLTLFDQLDADGDQLVTVQEIKNAIHNLAQSTAGDDVHSQATNPTAPTPEGDKSAEDLLAEYMNSGRNNNF